MNNILSAVERIRPETEPLDPAWSAAKLTEILQHDDPAQRQPRRRRTLLVALALATTAAAFAVLVPSFIDVRDGGSGASAAAAAVLTQAAVTLEAQSPTDHQYLMVSHVNRYWEGGEERIARGSVIDWVPGNVQLPMIEQTTHDGVVTDTGAHSLSEYGTSYYTREGRSSNELLDDLDEAAKAQDSDSGRYQKNVWDQAFRELQSAAVPVSFKANVLRALRDVPGVSVRPTSNQFGSLQGTALVFRDDPVAFVFDKGSNVFLGISVGVDNPNAKAVKTPSTWELRTTIVRSAPEAD